MAYDGDTKFLERRAASINGTTPKSGPSVMKAFTDTAGQRPPNIGYFKEGPMLKVRCKRLANQNTVVGKTVFKFNSEGIASVVDQGWAKYDFEEFLKLNGVQDLRDEPIIAAPVVSATVPAVSQPVVEATSVDAVNELDITADMAIPAVENKPRKRGPVVKPKGEY